MSEQQNFQFTQQPTADYQQGNPAPVTPPFGNLEFASMMIPQASVPLVQQMLANQMVNPVPNPMMTPNQMVSNQMVSPNQMINPNQMVNPNMINPNIVNPMNPSMMMQPQMFPNQMMFMNNQPGNMFMSVPSFHFVQQPVSNDLSVPQMNIIRSDPLCYASQNTLPGGLYLDTSPSQSPQLPPNPNNSPTNIALNLQPAPQVQTQVQAQAHLGTSSPLRLYGVSPAPSSRDQDYDGVYDRTNSVRSSAEPDSLNGSRHYGRGRHITRSRRGSGIRSFANVAKQNARQESRRNVQDKRFSSRPTQRPTRLPRRAEVYPKKREDKPRKYGYRSKQKKIEEVFNKMKNKFQEEGLWAPMEEVLRGDDTIRLHVKKFDALNEIENAIRKVEEMPHVKVIRVSMPESKKNTYQKKGFLCYLKMAEISMVEPVQKVFKAYGALFGSCAVAKPSLKHEQMKKEQEEQERLLREREAIANLTSQVSEIDLMSQNEFVDDSSETATPSPPPSPASIAPTASTSEATLENQEEFKVEFPFVPLPMIHRSSIELMCA